MHANLGQTLPVKPFRFVAVSSNKKTGPIPVSSTAAQSCPTACPMRTDAHGGCYAASGNSAIHWRALSEGRAATALDAAGLLGAVSALSKGQLWRMNEAGDLPSDSAEIDAEFLRSLTAANKGKRGFTYTHHELTAENTAEIKRANNAGFTVNISTNNPAHADRVMNAGYSLPVVTLMTGDEWQGKNTAKTPAGYTIVRCPAEYLPNITCNTCGLCAVNTRKGIVGFTAHGTSKRRVINIVNSGV